MNIHNCSVCLHDTEDDQHIFRFCPLATEAWEGNGLHIKSYHHPSMPLASWLVFWLEKYIKEDGFHGLRLPLFIGTLWAVWKTRNNQVFRQVRATLEVFNVYLTEGMHDHTLFTANGVPTITTHTAPNFTNPPGFIATDLGQVNSNVFDLIIQIDGSWDKSTGQGGVAWVATQHMNPIQSNGKFIYASTAIQTEAMACLEALRGVLASAFTRIMIVTDSEILVRSLASQMPSDISILHTIGDIRATSASIHSCRILKVSRTQVQQAHELAHHCRVHRVNVA